MKRPPHVYIGQYQSWVIGFLGWDLEDAGKYVDKHWNVKNVFKVTANDIAQCGAIVKEGRTISFIHLPRWRRADNSCIALLTHEALHACMFILNELGQDVQTHGSGHEHLTYMLQFVVQGLLDQSQKKREKK